MEFKMSLRSKGSGQMGCGRYEDGRSILVIGFVDMKMGGSGGTREFSLGGIL